ncbi:hypothetical protein CWN94_01275 [Vibrio splendidus]|nr:hypothetical protein BCS88_20345 [Vibrio splendidus]PTO57096.1 hypothetical protein CWN94_01275 [Vibrio splendidus]
MLLSFSQLRLNVRLERKHIKRKEITSFGTKQDSRSDMSSREKAKEKEKEKEKLQTQKKPP